MDHFPNLRFWPNYSSYLKMWSAPSVSLIGILNAHTSERRGNLPFTLTCTLGLFWFKGDVCWHASWHDHSLLFWYLSRGCICSHIFLEQCQSGTSRRDIFKRTPIEAIFSVTNFLTLPIYSRLVMVQRVCGCSQRVFEKPQIERRNSKGHSIPIHNLS